MGKLLDFADIFLGKAPPRREPSENNVAVPVLSLRDVGGRIAPREQLESVEAPAGSEALRIAEPGDIVMTARGRLRVALVEHQHAGVAVGPNLILLRLKGGFPAPLMVAYLRHPEIERRLMMETAGTATPGISVEGLRQLETQLPPEGSWADATELVESVDLYHDEILESARLLRQGVSEWLFDQMTEARR